MRFEKWLEETTSTAGVAQNLAKGKVDVIGAKGKCPDGMTWDAKQLECVPDIKVKEGKKECPEGHEWDEKMQECLPSSTGIKEEEEKDCPEGQRWCPIQKKCVTPNRLREALSGQKLAPPANYLSSKVVKEYMKDPLYKKVITAKSREEYNKAMDTLKNIRGEGAVTNFKKALQKEMKK